MTRRKLRQKAMQILYAHMMTKDSIDKIISDQLSDIENEEDRSFAIQLVNLVVENEKEFDILINSIVNNWDLERIALLDHIIIKICLSEFLYMESVPAKVSIDEAIDLAKNFSTKNSGRFVNGILDSILINQRKKGTIIKTGKGLVGDGERKAIVNNSKKMNFEKNTFTKKNNRNNP